jgi:hypothetical protein
MRTDFMASAKQKAWRKKFAKLYGKKKTGAKSSKPKKSNSKKNGGRFIHYNYETKAKANQSRKEFQQAGEKIKPPYQRKMKVPHHGNNYYYWTIARPVTW